MSLLAGALIGGIANGILNGAMTTSQAKKNAKAHKQYAKDIRNAAEKYTGSNAYSAMQEKGNQQGNITNIRELQGQIPQGNAQSAMAKTADLQNGFGSGYNLGSSNEKAKLNSQYNYDTASAQAALNQADINYKAGTAAQQAAMNTMGGLADLYKTTSDENQKEGANNESGLPESGIEDSLRQLETVSYKYKDPSVAGCDDETHDSGFTAQSLEKTPMGKDIVKDCDDGVKRIDNWKLQEALTAGMAQLQREIDELEKNTSETTSDELCKETYRPVTKRKNEVKVLRR